MAEVILISSLVTHNSLLPHNSGLIALLVAFLYSDWLLIPRLVIVDL
jgi:hypothetical protein